MIARMTAGKHDKYIVDILPNLKHLMRVPGMVRDCKAPLEAFEQKVSSLDKGGTVSIYLFIY